MFECSCTHGYELNPDGYSCQTEQNNISNIFTNESKYDEDSIASDVFYQKGVSFSAKLETNEINEETKSFNDVSTDVIAHVVDNQR